MWRGLFLASSLKLYSHCNFYADNGSVLINGGVGLLAKLKVNDKY